jgi:hypothetical protein
MIKPSAQEFIHVIEHKVKRLVIIIQLEIITVKQLVIPLKLEDFINVMPLKIEVFIIIIPLNVECFIFVILPKIERLIIIMKDKVLLVTQYIEFQTKFGRPRFMNPTAKTWDF